MWKALQLTGGPEVEEIVWFVSFINKFLHCRMTSSEGLSTTLPFSYGFLAQGRVIFLSITYMYMYMYMLLFQETHSCNVHLLQYTNVTIHTYARVVVHS